MITVMTGSNTFLLKTELDKRVQAFLAVHGDMGLERIDGEEAEFNRVQEAVTSLPFLASKKLVVLRNPSAIKVFTEKITDIITEIPESTDLIIYESKLDKRGTYYKTLKAKTDLKEYNELDVHGLARWLVEQAKSQGGEITQADAMYLVERVGASQQLLSNELAKLLHYATTVTRQTIELLTEATPQSTIFELLDAALTGRTKQAMAIYHEQRKLKVEPQQILAMLAWQLHILALVKTADGRSVDDMAAQSKVSAFTLRKSQGIASRLSLGELRALIKRVLAIDISLKSQSIDADDALQNLIVSL